MKWPTLWIANLWQCLHIMFFSFWVICSIMAAMINGCRLAREIWQMEKNNEQKNKFTQFSGHWLKLNLADTSLSLSNTFTNKGSLQQWRRPCHRPHHYFRDNSDCLLHLWLKNQPDFSHFLGSLIMLSLCVSRLLGAGLHWLYNWLCLPLMMIITMARHMRGDFDVDGNANCGDMFCWCYNGGDNVDDKSLKPCISMLSFSIILWQSLPTR